MATNGIETCIELNVDADLNAAAGCYPMEKAWTAAHKEADRRAKEERTYDVIETGRDRSLHTKDNRRMVERQLRAVVASIGDPSELDIALELEAMFSAMLDAKIAAMADKNLPASQRFSFREMAANSSQGITHVTFFNRAKRALTGKTRPGPKN
jgi:tRNA A37 N6-isopentenylltransferase MiaA